MKKVSFHTLGCKLNFAETSTLARGFAAAGFVRVASDDGEGEGSSAVAATGGGVPHADVYVINSCSVTAAADKKCRNLVTRLHRRSPGALIVVTGCYAQLDPERVAAIPGVDIVLGNEAKGDVVAAVTRRLGMPAAASLRSFDGFAYAPRSVDGKTGDEPADVQKTAPGQTAKGSETVPGHPVDSCGEGAADFYPAYSAGERTRSFLKVQDGCDYRCSYCTIPAARGRSRNIPIARVVDQAREIAARGVREIVLTGINTGDFGRTTGEKFIDLLKALDAVEGIARYRISSIEPNLLTDEIIDFCAASRAFQPHFHIPLQSGSDRVLGLMRRRYVAETFAGRVERVREAMPDAFIGVDVIVGFPGETDGDHASTRALLERVRPVQLHVFPYSVRPGTPAASMPGRVPPPVAAVRAADLGALSDGLHAAFRARFAGTEAAVLWEGEQRDGTMAGFTANYLKVSVPHDPALTGTITRVTV